MTTADRFAEFTNLSLPSAHANAGSARRIAIIGVHGVGKHERGETANAIAGLLLSLGADGRARSWEAGAVAGGAQPEAGTDGANTKSPGALYSGFDAKAVQIPVAPLAVSSEAVDIHTRHVSRAKRVATRVKRSFSERRGYLAQLHRSGGDADDRGRVGYEYLRQQLADYRGSDPTRAYITTRLEGRRGGDRGGDVHVYEMHWADISRLRQGPLAFFGALFQVFIHIATLGRQALDAARAEQPSRWWRLMQDAHAYMLRLLLLFVPVLNFMLLLTGLSILPSQMSVGAAPRWIAVIGAALAAMYGLYVLLRPRWSPRRAFTWSAAPAAAAAAGAIGAIAALRAASANHLADRTVLLIEWWITGGILTFLATSMYERVRPGAKVVGFGVFGLSAAAFFAYYGLAAHRGYGPQADDIATFWAMQIVYGAIMLTWRALYVCAAVAIIAAIVCAVRDARSGDGERYARTRAVLRTTQLTAALSGAAFLFSIIILWSGVYRFTVERFGVFHCIGATQPPLPRGLGIVNSLVPDPADIANWLPRAQLAAPENCSVVTAGGAVPLPTPPLYVREYFGGLLATSITTGLPVALALIFAALFLLVWMALPSLAMEEQSPSRCTNGAAKRAGKWLSRGLDATSVVTWLTWSATFVVIPAFAIVDMIARATTTSPRSAADLAPTTQLTLFLLDKTGAAIAASAAVLVFAIAKYGGSALDTLLDVDNYLRNMPPRSTPTARVIERYASLLRHVAAHRDERTSRGYDAIVIVAHSLGTAITADVLRVLTREAGQPTSDASLESLGFGPGGDAARRVPIYFFSMGSPLRQLMNRFFPHRFWWVREVPDNAREELPETGSMPASGPASETPRPSELGVQMWSNAYRSSDYVGRGLWQNEWYGRTLGGDETGGYPEPLTAFESDDRWEACIGLGAHTHYWDGTAPDVAERLEAVVRSAVDVGAR